jgi:hypothetical protein
MNKSLNKWLRKIHRWIAVPTFLSIPLMLFIRLTKGAYISAPPQFEAGQQLLIFLLAVTGAYLYLLPYMAKAQRKKKNSQEAK